MRTVIILAALMVPALGAVACGELKPTTMQLGRSLNSDNSIGNHATSFKPDDTIYAAVLTDGIASGTISAKWTYAGRVISEPQKQVRYRGPAATEFHIQNSGGFPAGEYEVELFVDGTSAGVRKFRVER